MKTLKTLTMLMVALTFILTAKASAQVLGDIPTQVKLQVISEPLDHSFARRPLFVWVLDTDELAGGTIDNDGKATFDLYSRGWVQIGVKVPEAISFYYHVYVGDQPIDLGIAMPAIGDVDFNDRIDDRDLEVVIFEFGEPSSYTYGINDLNRDGIVDDFDLLAVIFNFGKSGKMGL